jgi:hypothetical protein
MKKRTILGLLVAIILIMATSCLFKIRRKDCVKVFYKRIARTSSYAQAMPGNYKYVDYASLARDFDALIFGGTSSTPKLPLFWADQTNQTFGIPAYVGDHRTGQDGEQEAVTTAAAVYSATLVGIDKADQHGNNYVQMLNAFFNPAEGVFLNNPGRSSADASMWYLLYPALLFAHVSQQYPEETQLRQNVVKTIESWYKAYEVMYNNGEPDFNYTGFNFLTNQPYKNGRWTEPDAAVGIAVLLYYGYELTGTEQYLRATINLLDYIDQFFGSPLYEVLMYYAPALMAKVNALHGTSYDLDKAISRVFDGNSIPRGGWGSLVGKWGDYEINGLFGSITDGGGYAFAMNTFTAAGALAPLAQYDPRYARDLGKWLLHASSNARYFYSPETKRENQSLSRLTGTSDELQAIIEVVPYEGIRKQSGGKEPWFGGDPTVYAWATTDFSLYSGAHGGIFGALFAPTNQEGILKIDLLATQLTMAKAYPTYLLYNPHSTAKEVIYQIKGAEPVDLYDTVTNTIVQRAVQKETKILIPADEAVVIVEIPANAAIVQRGLNNYVDGIYLSSNRSTVSFKDLKNFATVKGRFTVELILASNFADEIAEAYLTIDGEVFPCKDNKVRLDTRNFTRGAKKVTAKVVTTHGLSDEATLRLDFQ